MVKTFEERLLASFDDPVAALKVALAAPGLLSSKESTRGLKLHIGVHRGPAMVATFNDHLDYFGTTVRQALALPGLAGAGGWVVSQAIMDDPQVVALLRSRGREGEVFRADLPGAAGAVLHRFAELG